MSRRVATALLAPAAALALVAASGCHTPVGTYFANRARDFGECWRAEVGLGTGVGVSVKALGVAHIPLGMGWVTPPWGIGWEYGAGYIGGLHTGELSPHFRTRGTDVGFPLMLFGSIGHGPTAIHAEEYVFLHGLTDDTRGHVCFAGLPAVWHDAHPRDAWDWIHIFDVEVSAHALAIGVRVGFSPGEFLDFLLGWFGVDLAGDDRAWEPPR